MKWTVDGGIIILLHTKQFGGDDESARMLKTKYFQINIVFSKNKSSPKMTVCGEEKKRIWGSNNFRWIYFNTPPPFVSSLSGVESGIKFALICLYKENQKEKIFKNYKKCIIQQFTAHR